jgi:hypothetical protein
MATTDELRKKREELELEDLNDRVEQRREQKAVRRMTHDSQEQALAVSRREKDARQRKCAHRKGGVDLKGVREGGNDANYAVWRIRMPNGEIWQHCSRCPALWKPGDTAKNHPTGIGYRTAIAWPTDNTMAEAAQFRFPQKRAEDAKQEPAEA